MVYSKKVWWLATVLILFAAPCGAATATSSTADDPANDSHLLSPRDGAGLLEGEADTAVTSITTPEVTIAANSAEVDADGIEVGFTEEGRRYRGNPDAPVLIEEFSDYQCPFCSRFVAQTFPSINDNQIANGEVLLIFYDFPLNIHPQAPAAANAARCAGEQGGQIWNMDSLIFKAITMNTVADFKRTNTFEFISTETDKHIAWVTYTLSSIIAKDGKQTTIVWLETVCLLKQNRQWKVKNLHSTLLNKS